MKSRRKGANTTGPPVKSCWKISDQRGLRAGLHPGLFESAYEKTVSSPNPLTGQPNYVTASPQHPEMAAFATGRRHRPDIFTGVTCSGRFGMNPTAISTPKPDARQYTAPAHFTTKAIRNKPARKPPSSCPASASFPWEFLETFLKSGLLEYLRCRQRPSLPRPSHSADGSSRLPKVARDDSILRTAAPKKPDSDFQRRMGLLDLQRLLETQGCLCRAVAAPCSMCRFPSGHYTTGKTTARIQTERAQFRLGIFLT